MPHKHKPRGKMSQDDSTIPASSHPTESSSSSSASSSSSYPSSVAAPSATAAPCSSSSQPQISPVSSQSLIPATVQSQWVIQLPDISQRFLAPEPYSHEMVLGIERSRLHGDLLVSRPQLILKYKELEAKFEEAKAERAGLLAQVSLHTEMKQELAEWDKKYQAITTVNKQLEEKVNALVLLNDQLRQENDQLRSERDSVQKRLRALEDNVTFEKRRRRNMSITAELVRRLERKILQIVFENHWKQRTMYVIQKAYMQEGEQDEDFDDEEVASLSTEENQRWDQIRGKFEIDRLFNGTARFCRFLRSMKQDRNHESHAQFQPKKSVAELIPIVLQYCSDFEIEQLEAAVACGEDSEEASVRFGQERVRYERWTKEMMAMVQSLVGDFPFGRERGARVHR